MNSKTIVWWVVRVLAAVIMIFFSIPKLTGDPDTIQMFTALGTEPWLRFVTAILELVGGIALLIPRTTLYGAVATALVALGAIGSHIAVLGFGFPFPLALVLLVLAGVIFWMTRGRDSVTMSKA